MRPTYDFAKLTMHGEEVKRKSATLREICSLRHERMLLWEKVKAWGTASVSIVVLCLTFFGLKELSVLTGISEESLTLALSVFSLALALFSIWNIMSIGNRAPYIHYKAIQDLASIENLIVYLNSAKDVSDEVASYFAEKITLDYENASRDIPRISEKEHDKAKLALKNAT